MRHCYAIRLDTQFNYIQIQAIKKVAGDIEKLFGNLKNLREFEGFTQGQIYYLETLLSDAAYFFKCKGVEPIQAMVSYNMVPDPLDKLEPGEPTKITKPQIVLLIVNKINRYL
jgi:hypothetical protein